MAFRARTVGRDISGTSHRTGGRPASFGAFTVGARFSWFPGEPPPEMLVSNMVLVRDCLSRPWPKSAEDRCGKHPPADAKPGIPGGRLAGPNEMTRQADEGLWPGERCAALSAYMDACIRDPEAALRRKLEQRFEGAALEQELTKELRRLAGASGLVDMTGIGEPTEAADAPVLDADEPVATADGEAMPAPPVATATPQGGSQGPRKRRKD